MVAATRNINEFRDEILGRIDEKCNALKTNIFAEFNDHINFDLVELLKEEFKKRKELDSTVSLLQEKVHHYQNQVNKLRRENKEPEQFDRYCVRVDLVLLVENETSGEVLDKVISLMQEGECDITEVEIDKAHSTGECYVDKSSKKYVKVS